MKSRTSNLMLAFAISALAFAATADDGNAQATVATPVAKIGDVDYASVDAAMEAAAANETPTTVTLLADSTDATLVPTWHVKSDVVIDAASPVTTTFAPTENATDANSGVGGAAYLTSADTSAMRTVTIGANVTLVVSNNTAKGFNAFYVGRDGHDAWKPVNLVLNGSIVTYCPYLGAQSKMTVSPTGSLKAEWSECLQTRWGSFLTVTGTDGGWSQEKPQASFSYVNQRGGEITFKDTFVRIGTTWGSSWTICNSDGKTDYATKLTLDNSSLDGVSRFTGSASTKGTSAYEIELKNKAKLTIKKDYAGNSGFFKNAADGVVKIEAGSLISAVSVENAGKFVIDATGITEATKVFDYTGADALTLESYGTVEVTGGSAYVEDNDLYVKPSSVAKIGSVEYTALAAAISAAKEGDTIVLQADVVNTDYAVANVVDIKLAKGVSLNGNGKTISGNVKVTVASEGGVTITNVTFKDIHNAAAVSDGYKTKYGFSDDKVGTLSAIYSSNLSGSLTITDCTFENADWESMQITPAPNAVIEIRDNVFKTSTSDVVKEQLRYVHIEMAWGSGYDHEGQNITLTVTDNQFLGDQVDSLCLWWAGKGSTLNLSGNYLGKPDSVSVTLSDAPSTGRENRSDLVFPARSQADVGTDDLQPVAMIVSDAYNQKFYATLADAIAAATSGKTVKLISDVTDTADAKSAAIHYDITGVTIDLNGHTYSHYNYAHVFQGTGGVIRNGKIVCLRTTSESTNWTYGSYALFIGDRANNGVATTSFTVEDVEITGGINICKATGVVLKNLKVNGTNYYAVWTQDNSSVTIESGTYASAGVAVLHGFSPSSMTITGGTFTGGDKPVVHSDTTASVAISGGTFDKMVDMKYCAEGFIVEANNDGGYSAVAFVAAKIGTTEYPSLASALADVAEGMPLTFVDERAWPVETPVYYAGAFYAATDTKGALEVAIDAANEANADDIAKIYVRPGYATEKGLVKQAHQPMKTSLAIYGNDATLSQKWEPCVEMTSESEYHWLKKDVSLAIYNLHGGAGFWGYRMTDYTVDLTLSACTNAHEVMLYGSANTSCKGRTNITVANCTFTATSGDGNNCICTIGPGDVEITDSTFTSVNVNVKNVNGGDNEIAVRNCAFKETKDGGKNIRVRAFESGSTASLNLERVTFDGAATNNVVIGDAASDHLGFVSYSIFRTAGSFTLSRHSATTAETTTLDSEKAYMGDNSADTAVTAAQIFEVTASTGSTAKVDLALTDDFLNSLENVKGDTAAEKVAALCAADSNGNPGWVNLVAGIEADKDVDVAAVEDNADGTIEMNLANIASSAVADVGTGSGLQVAFAVDVVDANGNVEKTGEASSSAAIDVNAVESNAIFSVKVLVRQNGATIASVPTTTLVGVQKTTRQATKTIISVPWGSLAGGSISVAELVMTSNLTVGDKLYVYNVGEKRYDVYTLAADKTWTPTEVYKIDANGQMSATSSGVPTETKIARGSGVWLERQDTSRPIVTYGQATNEKQETTMASGSVEKPAWNLVAVPTTESISLDAIAAPTDDAAKNDKVIVPTDGAPKIFTVENGKWGYSEAVSVTNANGKATGIVRVERKTDAKLEPGTGFWYLNAGSSEKKVEW